jgi:hypothetical protein
MTDWSLLIAQLERHMRHIDIAAHCDRSEGWVGLVKRRIIKDPPYTQGQQLIELAAQYGIAPRETQHPQVAQQQTA